MVKAWLNAELFLFYNSYYEMFMSGMVPLLGDSVYLLYLVCIVSMALNALCVK